MQEAVKEITKYLKTTDRETIPQEDFNQLKDLLRQLHEFISYVSPNDARLLDAERGQHVD